MTRRRRRLRRRALLAAAGIAGVIGGFVASLRREARLRRRVDALRGLHGLERGALLTPAERIYLGVDLGARERAHVAMWTTAGPDGRMRRVR